MRLKRGWTKRRIVEEFCAGKRVVEIAIAAYPIPRNAYWHDEQLAAEEADTLVEAILRAALRERTR